MIKKLPSRFTVVLLYPPSMTDGRIQHHTVNVVAFDPDGALKRAINNMTKRQELENGRNEITCVAIFRGWHINHAEQS